MITKRKPWTEAHRKALNLAIFLYQPINGALCLLKRRDDPRYAFMPNWWILCKQDRKDFQHLFLDVDTLSPFGKKSQASSE